MVRVISPVTGGSTLIDVRAEVREDHRAVGPGHGLGQVDDADVLERVQRLAHAPLPSRRRATLGHGSRRLRSPRE
jgi:hypothetical protein